MCDTCSHDIKDSYLNWLRHHEPVRGFTDKQEQTLYDHSVTVLLTLRLSPITVDEILDMFDVTKEEAKTLELSINKILEDLEDCLINSTSAK